VSVAVWRSACAAAFVALLVALGSACEEAREPACPDASTSGCEPEASAEDAALPIAHADASSGADMVRPVPDAATPFDANVRADAHVANDARAADTREASVDAALQGDAASATSRGASVPYQEYEAERAETNGTILPPSRNFGEIAAESSERSAVRLDATGHFVSLRSTRACNTIVVRFVIPDAPGGGGSQASLGLYIDGVRKLDLALSSRHAWLYGGESASENNPGPGAHHFYDEVQALIGDVPAGASIKLQKDAQDSAPYYVIDLIDLEQAPAALLKPAEALSVLDFGATPDDASDDSAAFQRALDAGKAQNKSVFVPRGNYALRSQPLKASSVRLLGAGMWYSRLSGPAAQIRLSGDNNVFSDLALFGDVSARRDDVPENGFDGPAGRNSRIENVWLEHHKVGYWVGKGELAGVPTTALTTGLTLRGLRVRNTFADGINLCNGTRDSVVEQSHFRSTGDDALASWSPSFDGPPNQNNVFRFNTVQLPWRANCFAIYGGSDTKIEDSVCADPLLYPGVLLSTTFRPHPFAGTTSIERVTLLRAGGPMYMQQHGALKIFADGLDIRGVRVRDLQIVAPTFSGVHVQGPGRVEDLLFENVRIETPGTAGIVVNADAQGRVQASDVVVVDAAKGLDNAAPASFSFQQLSGNRGW
jgi:hypothetical protein